MKMAAFLITFRRLPRRRERRGIHYRAGGDRPDCRGRHRRPDRAGISRADADSFSLHPRRICVLRLVRPHLHPAVSGNTIWRGSAKLERVAPRHRWRSHQRVQLRLAEPVDSEFAVHGPGILDRTGMSGESGGHHSVFRACSSIDAGARNWNGAETEWSVLRFPAAAATRSEHGRLNQSNFGLDTRHFPVLA